MPFSLFNKYFFYLTCLLSLGCKNKIAPKETKEINSDIVQIFLKEFNIYFSPDSCNCKMQIELPNQQGILKIAMTECKGTMQVLHFNLNNKLISDFKYSPSLDTFKRYSIGKSSINGIKKVFVLNYFQPLPNGIWKYYNGDYDIKTIEYVYGVLKE